MEEPSMIVDIFGDILCFLPYICALVFHILVDVLEFLESLDDVEVIAEIQNDVLRAGVETIVQDRQGLQKRGR